MSHFEIRSQLFKNGSLSPGLLRKLPAIACGPCKLKPMSDLSSTTAQKEPRNFASLLASLTGGTQIATDAWDDSTLAEDVATISYEQALRSHRRVPATEMLTEVSDIAESPAAKPTAPMSGKNRKNASITIRLTRDEEAQLHERAATAQLSVSAYLRSCIFEAESLRAQVKEALSQIRTTADPPHPSPATSWRSRLLPHWRRSPSA